MKKTSISLLSMIIILCWLPSGFADRLYHRVDSNGVTHLSKNPPPNDDKLVEIREYTARTDEPATPDPDKTFRGPEKPKNEAVAEKRTETVEQPAPRKNLTTACYLYADMEDVYVYAHELSTPGGPQIRILCQGTIVQSGDMGNSCAGTGGI